MQLAGFEPVIQQTSGFRPTSQTALTPGSAKIYDILLLPVSLRPLSSFRIFNAAFNSHWRTVKFFCEVVNSEGYDVLWVTTAASY